MGYDLGAWSNSTAQENSHYKGIWNLGLAHRKGVKFIFKRHF